MDKNNKPTYQDKVKQIIREFIDKLEADKVLNNMKNDITGDEIKTKPANKQYMDNYDKIRWNAQQSNRSDAQRSPTSDDLNTTKGKV